MMYLIRVISQHVPNNILIHGSEKNTLNAVLGTRRCRSSEVIWNMIYNSLEDGYNRMWAKNIHSFSPCISSQSQPSCVQSIEHILKGIRRRWALLGTKGIYLWVYVTFHLQWSWKGNWLHSNLVPSLFVEFSVSRARRFDLLPLDLSRGYHFFIQMD